MLALARERAKTQEPLKAVNDQWGTPTYTYDVCRQTWQMLQTRPPSGIYHSTSEGHTTWFEFAQEIVHAFGIQVPVLPCTSQEFPRPAKRPKFGVLENQKLKQLGINMMLDWKVSFYEFVAKYKAVL